MTTKVLSFKTPAEKIRATFDFSPYLGAATVQTKSVACAVDAGTDANAAAMVSGNASESGGVVSQLIVDGVAGNDYRLTATVTLTDGRTLELASILPVRAA